MRPYSKVIIRPLLTEKNAKMKDTDNRVAFEVAPDANKIEIKRAVEEAFKVSVKWLTFSMSVERSRSSARISEDAVIGKRRS